MHRTVVGVCLVVILNTEIPQICVSCAKIFVLYTGETLSVWFVSWGQLLPWLGWLRVNLSRS